MKTSCFLRVSLASTLLTSHLCAFAQDLTFADVLKGDKYPITLKISDLPPDLKAVRLKVQGEGGIMDMLMPFMGIAMMGGGNSSDSMAPVMQVFDTSWTKGETVKISGQDYLITYKMDLTSADMMRKSAPKADDLILKLTLLKTSAVNSMTPLALDKAGLLKMIATLDKQPAEGAMTTTAPLATGDIAARQAASVSNAKQLSLGMLMYVGDFDDVAPYAQSTAAVKFAIRPYLKNDGLWKSLNPNGGEFKYNISIGGAKQSSIDRPAETVLFYEEYEWPDGSRVVAFADGHAKTISHEQWPTVSATLHLRNLKRVGKPLPMDYGIGK